MFDAAPQPNGRNDMTVLFVDAETMYSSDYSLTKMSPAEYILDPRFEMICLSVANLTGAPIIVDGPEVPIFLERLKRCGKPIAMVSHNATFDMAILNWRYGYKPDLIIDTIAMSRTVLGPLLSSHSLDSVAQFLNLPAKGSLIKQVKGMTRADIIASGMWDQEVEYCNHDNWLCREIYTQLLPKVPPEEFVLHDMINRCTTEPVLRINRILLEQHLANVLAKKQQALWTIEQMGIGKTHLMSNPKFADVLRSLGVEPPTKISPTTNERTFAFSKQDRDFTDLLDHPNDLVRTVVAARLETKSTIEETRTRRFISISQIDFGQGAGYMPMPVIIGAAHTHRFGGTWDLNVQNLGRESELRDAIYADDGQTLLVVDSRQIEARFTAWFCGQDDLVEQFERGEDVYSNFATEIFDVPLDAITKVQRFVGKTGILQLGYASGHIKFGNTVYNLSRTTDNPVILAPEASQDVVQKYRRKMDRITGTWRELDHVLATMWQLPEEGKGEPRVMKCVQFYKYLMIGPTGLPVRFPGLFYDPENGSYYFKDGQRLRRTYGASLLETISQHCCRCIVMSAAVRLRVPMEALGARLVHTAHDELVYSVPEERAEAAKELARLEMNRRPAWAPELPLDTEVATALRYGDAK